MENIKKAIIKKIMTLNNYDKLWIIYDFIKKF